MLCPVGRARDALRRIQTRHAAMVTTVIPTATPTAALIQVADEPVDEVGAPGTLRYPLLSYVWQGWYSGPILQVLMRPSKLAAFVTAQAAAADLITGPDLDQRSGHIAARVQEELARPSWIRGADDRRLHRRE